MHTSNSYQAEYFSLGVDRFAPVRARVGHRLGFTASLLPSAILLFASHPPLSSCNIGSGFAPESTMAIFNRKSKDKAPDADGPTQKEKVKFSKRPASA
jgi:hypothetical protein